MLEFYDVSRRPLVQPNVVHVEEFAEHLRDICGGFDVVPFDRKTAQLTGDVKQTSVAGFEAALVGLNAKNVQRDRRHLRDTPGEHLFLLFQLQGDCQVAQGEGVTQLRPGGMYLVDSTLPSNFIYNGCHSQQLSVHIPRQDGRVLFGESCFGGVEFRAQDPIVCAITAVLQKLLNEGLEPNPMLSKAFIDLIGSYLYIPKAQAGSTQYAAMDLLERAKTLIQKNASDPKFNTEMLAQALGVSSRTLQRHFESIGETITGSIRDARLDNVYEILIRDRTKGSRQKIGDVAYKCGFGDLSYFNRSFRQRFGCTPKAMSQTQ
ncbi:AraC family transcriptional regulator [Thioclava dalianensis]|uniref:AraC family transcriptional regulator n=1 Tax=Thioclava dalianensis TaxID=1185766 RepID=A0A074TE39_9RHOB|nr:helix-turn-helix domain-containing protein [Thioclava dalianensis]KEP69959.1 AraC family transcriptional regulator [Thioclava dalianensis]SFN18142.1 AraC-type DNA-binding protein [Thioclava dalianensis]